MLSELFHYQGKTDIFNLKFQNDISQNTGKYKLGRFSLRRSHMYTS